MQRYFSKMLRRAPVLEFSSTDEIYLVLDGTYFPNDICLVVYRNFHLRSTQLYRMTNGEHFEEIASKLAKKGMIWVDYGKNERAYKLLAWFKLKED